MVLLGVPVETLAQGAYFTLGSTEAEVITSMGPPTRTFEIEGMKWFWGINTVQFRDGRVVGWRQSFDHKLKVKLEPSDPVAADRARQRGYLELGSTEDEVLALQGTPDAVMDVIDTQWHFGWAHVELRDGRVSGWFQSLDNDLRLAPGAPNLQSIGLP